MGLDTWQTDFMESLNMDRHQEYSNSLKVVRVGVSNIYSGFIIGCGKVFPSGVKFSSNPVQPLQRFCHLQLHSVGKIRIKTLNKPMWPTPTNKTYYLFVSILSQVCKLNVPQEPCIQQFHQAYHDASHRLWRRSQNRSILFPTSL